MAYTILIHLQQQLIEKSNDLVIIFRDVHIKVNLLAQYTIVLFTFVKQIPLTCIATTLKMNIIIVFLPLSCCYFLSIFFNWWIFETTSHSKYDH